MLGPALAAVAASLSLGAAAPRAQLSADEQWHPRTAHAAAVRLLGAVDRMDSSVRARKTLCAAMDPGVRAYFEPQVAGYRNEATCDELLELLIFADEDVPKVVSTTHRGHSLEIHGGRAILSTRLVHRFHSYDDPRRLAIPARVLLVRDGQGSWRMATLTSLLPLVAVDDPHHVDTPDDLEHEYLAWVRAGRKIAASLRRLVARRAAATVHNVAAAPCAPPLSSDPVGDVVVDGSDKRVPDQVAHADVDIVGFAAVGHCLALRTSAPLPPTFGVYLDDEGIGRSFEITVIGGRTLVQETTDVNDGVYPKPLHGIVAHAGPDGLVIALPVALSGKVRIALSDERPDVAYEDVVTSVRASIRRCARPTC